MTKKRDLKRRVRERQAQTQESYVTARRHVMAAVAERAPEAARPPQLESATAPPSPAAEPEAPPRPGIDVVELIDLTADAKRLGLMCPVRMYPMLAQQVEPERVLQRLREALLDTLEDPAMARWRAAVLRGQRTSGRSWMRDRIGAERFIKRVIAGIGGLSDDGLMLALHVAGKDGPVAVVAVLWLPGVAGLSRGPSVSLTTVSRNGKLPAVW